MLGGLQTIHLQLLPCFTKIGEQLATNPISTAIHYKSDFASNLLQSEPKQARNQPGVLATHGQQQVGQEGNNVPKVLLDFSAEVWRVAPNLTQKDISPECFNTLMYEKVFAQLTLNLTGM